MEKSSTVSRSSCESTHSGSAISSRQTQFKSRKIKGPVDKPWLLERIPRKQIWADRIVYIGWVIGVLLIAALAYLGYTRRESHKFCLVWEDNFDTLDYNVWEHEVSVGGFGIASFEWTTNSTENSWVEDGVLHMKSTLTDMSQYQEGSVVNLTATGECTVVPPTDDACVARMNATAKQIINPVKAVRMNTKNSVSMKYGKLEMRAKIPQADWNWAAFWLLPVNNTYGIWPKSGEIDVFEVRGNNYSYINPGNVPAGSNTMNSAIHHGGSASHKDPMGFLPLHGKSLGDDWHTYGLIWTKDSIRTYLDNEARTVIYHKFQEGETWQSGFSSNTAAPYDQPFYIILNIAVGTANGYFSEDHGAPKKPWNDGALRLGAMKQFYDNRDQWIDTWEDEKSEYLVDWIKLYKMCD